MTPSAGDLGRAAVEHCRALLRLDTSNPGSDEEAAARYVADTLAAAGVGCEVVEAAPGRCSVVSRIPGDAPGDALLVHGHLDVVPAGEGWTHEPFAADEADGCLWGRGAIDMKATVATMLAAQCALAGPRHGRDLVFAYFADEEMGGELGSRHVVEHRPELLAGVTDAIGELGGFPVDAGGGRRVYPIQCAEKGMLWLRVVVPGQAGHAALSDADNPIPRLAELLAGVARLELDETPPEAHVALTHALARELGGPPDRALGLLGAFGAMAHHGARTRFVPTTLAAGAKVNVLPASAEAMIDCRCLPGRDDDAIAAVRALLRDGEELSVTARSPGIEAPPSGALYDACAAALRRADPTAIVVPFVLAAGSDAQRLAPLGIRGYGFAPLLLPAGFDGIPTLLHAADERVPVEAVARGADVLLDLLQRY